MEAYIEQDSKYVNSGNYRLYCNTNEALLGRKPRGIVVEFPGLGGGSCLGGTMDMVGYGGDYAKTLADSGLLLVYMFSGPWNWMNEGVARFTDLVLAALREKFGLSGDVPVAATGGSMGGHSGLMFPALSKSNVVLSAVTCPCVDPEKSLFVDDVIPRSFLSTLALFDKPLEDSLKEISPAAKVKKLPDIPYLILCDANDELFPREDLEAFATALRGKGRSVEFITMNGCRHGEFTQKARERFTAFIIENI